MSSPDYRFEDESGDENAINDFSDNETTSTASIIGEVIKNQSHCRETAIEEYGNYKNVNDFKNLKDMLDVYKLKFGNNATMNIFIPGGASYSVPPNAISTFFDLVNKCRKQNVLMHYAEKQDPNYSGIMIDLDINHYQEIAVVTKSMIESLLIEVCSIIRDKVNFNTTGNYFTHIGVLHSEYVRRKQIKIDDKYIDVNRESIHLLLPGIKVCRELKKNIMTALMGSNDILEIFPEEMFPFRKSMIDAACAYAPVHFIGCCKNKENKRPDPLKHIYQVNFGRNIKITRVDENKWPDNICYEFSLNHENQTEKKKFIHKFDFQPIDTSILNNVTNTNVSVTRREEIRREIVLRSNENSDFETIAKLVAILSQYRCEDFIEWNKVIFALACGGKQFRTVALNFTMRSSKFVDESYFDNCWSRCINDAEAKTGYSVYPIYEWARLDNPKAYANIIAKDAYQLFEKQAIGEFSGRMNEHTLSSILKLLVQSKYKAFTIPITKTTVCRCWLEYVAEDDKYIPGQVHKYILYEGNTVPNNLLIYISEHLCNMGMNIAAKIEILMQRIGDSNSDKYKFYSLCKKNLTNRMFELGNVKPRKAIVDALHSIINDNTIIHKLNNYPQMLGVGNGILVLNEKVPYLINSYHTNYITVYTPTEYVPYNPNDPDIIKVEKIFRDLFHADDTSSYEFIMCWLASSLDAKQKPELFLYIYGSGANGKSMISDIMTSALGDSFCYTAPSNLITNKISKADGANSAVAGMKGKRCIFYDEFQKDDVINDCPIKTYVNGFVSVRELYSQQENIQISAIHTAFSNHEMNIIVNDYGTWRRILFMKLKMCFYRVNDPKRPYDPNNPYHRIRDEKIKSHYIKTKKAKQAILSVLVKWYQILQIRYGGNIANVPKPEIDRETEEYQNSQNHLDKFINNFVVKTSSETSTLIEEIAIKFIEWYNKEFEKRGERKKTESVIREIISGSRLTKLNAIVAKSGREERYSYIIGYRVLGLNEPKEEDEEYISEFKGTNNNLHFDSVDHKMTLEEFYKEYETVEPIISKEPDIEDHIQNPEPLNDLCRQDREHHRSPKPNYKSREYNNDHNLDISDLDLDALMIPQTNKKKITVIESDEEPDRSEGEPNMSDEKVTKSAEKKLKPKIVVDSDLDTDETDNDEQDNSEESDVDNDVDD